MSHGHHVCWPVASRLINKQSGMERQIRDRGGGGAVKRGVGDGYQRGHWRMMRDYEVSMQLMVCCNADDAQAALYNIIHILIQTS